MEGHSPEAITQGLQLEALWGHNAPLEHEERGEEGKEGRAYSSVAMSGYYELLWACYFFLVYRAMFHVLLAYFLSQPGNGAEGIKTFERAGGLTL